ncbi:MAG: SDR family oxidoreductase [Gammaproteobacteria bacterium]|jgi:meso-butanediol dehydrogenase/(S,S)-butanediol dehydrogenase/diacetyl reductase|nr:SDR family oxidoreductase [Gammaproteobacteria bacterium]MBK9468859.1 SDR family oxidoreductase [Gammaproteobacteria bacterium]MBP6480108.1 SDR family oxidoreductase [Pseudomonadales bacterium]MBP7910574.1 SDR family oxidoreductase [Pseudomonadales bacterium]
MQVAIITGAGSGIGLATARMLHDMGMAIVGIGRDPVKLKALAESIGDPGRLAAVSVDITAKDAPKRIVDQALERFGRIDFLVNNAGIGSPRPLHETDDDTLDHFLDIMLRAPFRLAREVVPHMQSGSGVVNVTSTFAMIGGKRGGAYSAAKGGLKSLTEHMACEYGPMGIRSNCVAPGVTMTDMVRHRFEDETFKRVNVETTPYPRLAEAEDIASVIAFLCSAGGEMINGQSIVVDGGWTRTKYLSPRALTSRWIASDEA